MARQRALPGVLSPKIQAVHDAAVDLLDAQGKAHAFKEKREELEAELVKQMRKAGLLRYAHSGIEVVLKEESKAKVKVRTVEAEKVSKKGKKA